MEKTIKCIKCGIEKSVSEFYLNSGVPYTTCKECHKEYTAARGKERHATDPIFRERVRLGSKKWRDNNKDRVSDLQIKSNKIHANKFPEKHYCRMMTKRMRQPGYECHH